MVGWHHALNGHESEWTPGVGDGQGGLACCDSWGRKELDATERLNWTELKQEKWTFICFCVFSSSFSFLDSVWSTRSAWSSKSTSATNQLGELKQVSNQSGLLVSLPGGNSYRCMCSADWYEGQKGKTTTTTVYWDFLKMRNQAMNFSVLIWLGSCNYHGISP